MARVYDAPEAHLSFSYCPAKFSGSIATFPDLVSAGLPVKKATARSAVALLAETFLRRRLDRAA
jgi:hypothetical protein